MELSGTKMSFTGPYSLSEKYYLLIINANGPLKPVHLDEIYVLREN